MLLFLTTNLVTMMSHANQQFLTVLILHNFISTAPITYMPNLGQTFMYWTKMAEDKTTTVILIRVRKQGFVMFPLFFCFMDINYFRSGI